MMPTILTLRVPVLVSAALYLMAANTYADDIIESPRTDASQNTGQTRRPASGTGNRRNHDLPVAASTKMDRWILQITSIFDLRSPIGLVPVTQPDQWTHGLPRRIDFVGHIVTSNTGRINRTVKRGSVGFLELDHKQRITARGIWESGTVTELHFSYDLLDMPIEIHLVRDGKQVGEKTAFRYSYHAKWMSIDSVQGHNHTCIGTEYQRFDKKGRLVSSSVQRGMTLVRLEYSYGSDGLPQRVMEYYDEPGTNGRFVRNASEIWDFQYDARGQMSNWSSTRIAGSRMIKRTISFTYDDAGNVATATYGEGKDARSTRFEYKFDEKGNWIDRIELPVGGLGEGSGYEVERTITYWD